MCLIGTEWTKTRDASCSRWLFSRGKTPKVTNEARGKCNNQVKWRQTTKFLPFWHKHAHCLKGPSSSTEHILALSVLCTGLMYIIGDQPQRKSKWRNNQSHFHREKRHNCSVGETCFRQENISNNNVMFQTIA